MERKRFFCIDAHTCGNPVRVVTGGVPFLEGNTMFEKRQYFMEHFDWIRTGLMFEPRGHDQMSGTLLYPPIDPENDLAVLFIETSGCLPMCGHGTIGMITVVVEEGLVTPKVPGEIRLETPAGLVRVNYKMQGKKVVEVKLTNVPSFLVQQNLEIESSHLGKLTFDVAYGGNFYAIVDPQEHFSGVQDYSASDLVSISRELRTRINESYPISFIHPENPSIAKVSHILWTGQPLDASSSARNAVFLRR